MEKHNAPAAHVNLAGDEQRERATGVYHEGSGIVIPAAQMTTVRRFAKAHWRSLLGHPERSWGGVAGWRMKHQGVPCHAR